MAADWRDFEIDEIPEWSARAQNAFFAVLSAILFCLFMYLLVLPLNEQEIQAQQKEKILKGQFRLKAQQVAALPNVDTQLEKLKIFYKRLTEQLPEEGDLAVLLAGINDTGLQYGLHFERLSWEKGAQVGWLYQLPLDIQLTGKYRDVGSFSAALARLPRIVALQDFTLERTKEAKDVLRFVVTAYTYRYIEEPGEKQ